MSEGDYDWIDVSISRVESSVDEFYKSFQEFCQKCDGLIEHMSRTVFDKQAIKEMVREAQMEALEEIISRFEHKGLTNNDPDVVKMLEGFRGVIEVWKDKEKNETQD